MIKKGKKIACALTIAMAVCTMSFAFGTNQASATTQNQKYESVSVTNSSFASNPSSAYLDTNPTGWTAGSGNTTKGIINVSNLDNKFSNNCVSNYHLQTTENPGKTGQDDDKVLMINAKEDSATDTTNLASDSYTSNTITLENFSQYIVTVWVNTINGAKASIALTGLSEDDMTTTQEATYISNISTGSVVNNWQKYSFYVQTATESQEIAIKLMLGVMSDNTIAKSYGAVFFDEVSVLKCSDDFFNQEYASETNADNISKITYETYDATPELNFSFEDGLDSWEKFGTYTNADEYTATTKEATQTQQGSTFTTDDDKVLLIESDEDNPVHVGFRSEAFDIKQANLYKISVWAKAIDVDGTIYINLAETDYLEKNYSDKETEKTTSSISFSSTEANQLTNDYQQFVFYVQGYELFDTQAKLELVFGAEDAKATGSVAFSRITVEQISYDTFTNATDDDTNNKVTLTTITTDPEFSNGAFNKAHSESVNVEYPLTPDSWTRTTENETYAIWGVVNTTQWANISATKKPFVNAPANPTIELTNGTPIKIGDTTSNNFLMMYNTSKVAQTVTSPTFSASANSYYLLSFNVQNYGNALTIDIVDSDGNNVYADKNITSSTAWTTYKVFIKTEYVETETLKLELTLDSTNSNLKTYAYFDNFQFTQLEDYQDENWETLCATQQKTVDLSNLGINLKGDFNTTTNVYEAIMFDGDLVSGTQVNEQNPIAFGGIITKDNAYGVDIAEASKNMLFIKTTAIADYKLTSKNTISLSADSYYKFSVKAKTSFTTQNTSDTNFGAYFGLVGIDDSVITKIVSGDDFDEYIIYVKTSDATTVNVKFGLTAETTQNQTAVFDNFAFETIDETAYSNAVASKNVLLVDATTNDADAEDTDEDADTSTNTTSSAALWLEISTIVLILAFVIAIIGAFIRKAQRQKIKAKKQKEFAQKANLVRDASVVEAEQRRNAEIAELIKEKHELENYMKELEEENKIRLAEQRKLSGKKITHKAEKDFKLYANNRQRIIKDMSKIDARIAEAETPEYLARIIKIVQNEKVKAMEEKATSTTPATQNTQATQTTTNNQTESNGAENGAENGAGASEQQTTKPEQKDDK